MAWEFLEDQLDNDLENSQLFEIRFCKVKFFWSIQTNNSKISVDWRPKEIYHVIIGVKSVEIWLIEFNALNLVPEMGQNVNQEYIKN